MSTNKISDYTVLDKIGHGATGRVWRARHQRTGEVVAIKELRSEFADDPEARERFLAEARLLEDRHLPGVVRVVHVIDDDAHVAIVMELVDGVPLREVLMHDAPLPLGRAADLGVSMASALAAAHESGLLHGDVKPENVLVVDVGTADETTVLTDFGLARVVRSGGLAATRSQAMGTPYYAAPEIHRGLRRHQPADVYALGVVLYEAITGRRPFDAANLEAVMRAHLDEDPIRTGEFSGAMWSLTSSCLAKDPAERPSASAVATELQRIRREGLTTPEAVATTRWTRSDAVAATEWSGGRGRRPLLLGSVAALALAAAAALGAVLTRDRTPEAGAPANPFAGVGSLPAKDASTPSSSASTLPATTSTTEPTAPAITVSGPSTVVSPAPAVPSTREVNPPPPTPRTTTVRPSPPTTVKPPPPPPPTTVKPPPPSATKTTRPPDLGTKTVSKSSTLSDGRTLEVQLTYTRNATQHVWHKVRYRVQGKAGAFDLNYTVYAPDWKKKFIDAVKNQPANEWRSVSLQDTVTSEADFERVLIQVYKSPKKAGSRLGDVRFDFP